MRHRLSGMYTYGLNGLTKGDEHPAYASVEYGTFTFTNRESYSNGSPAVWWLLFVVVKANKSRDLVEANVVVYSVTDRASFQYAQSCLQELRPAKRHNVVILVANKQDIVRNRVISEQG